MVIQIVSYWIIFYSVTAPLHAQDFNNNREKFRVAVTRISDPVELDGHLKENTWHNADVAKDFFRVTPVDTGYAISQTEVRMAYDDQHLYMSIVCFDAVEGKRPAESLRRDFNFGKNDNFLAFIDTYNDRTNGFSFGISAAGAQWDGLQANGGFVALDWDCKWRSAIHNEEHKWIAEFAIPFRSIRYQEGVREWGINFSRQDLKSNEKSSWAPIPRQFQTANLAFTGTAVFDEPPPKLGTRFSLIPYVSGRVSRDFVNNRDAKSSGDAGLDAKVTLSTSMNLDLTVNPDFSQVEVDRQVTNLDRFELFFPERRQFFLENSDLFASLGTESIRPFFSRRIGLNIPVQVGARLSGKIGDDWRVGAMNMQTGSDNDIPAANFTVATFQKKVFSRSNFGGFLVNKIHTGDLDSDHFNRVAGLEYNLASQDSRWTGKAFYHRSFSPDVHGSAGSLALAYNTQYWTIGLQQALVENDFSAETGFVRRRNFYQVRPSLGYRFFPSNRRMAFHGPSADLNIFYNLDGKLTDRMITLDYRIQWLDRSELTLALVRDYVLLQAPFDPTNRGLPPLPAGLSFGWNVASAKYISDARKLFNFSLSALYGGFFNGDRLGVEWESNYRVQPFGSLGIAGAFNRLYLPLPYGNQNLFLLGPKLDITFTDKIFFTTFVQYNSQIENINVNMRFQWRYAPVSDLFVVYTGNSHSTDFDARDKALVVKVSYYFN